MTDREMLREWFISLSDMIGGDLEPDASFDEGMHWFTSIDDETLERIMKLGNGNPSIQEFLELGQELMNKIEN